jgi:hypothetical protein
MLAIGAASTFDFTFGDPATAIMRGGGNIVRVVTPGELYPDLGGGVPPYDTGVYGKIVGDVRGDGTTTGDVNILMPTSILVQKGSTYTGGATGFFQYLGFPDLSTWYLTNSTYVTFGNIGGQVRIGYVIGTSIERESNRRISDKTDIVASLNRGALKCSYNYNPAVATNSARIVDLTGVYE